MEPVLLGLARHVETGQNNERFAEDSWAPSEEGRAFITASSDAWTAASAAYGTNDSNARRAGTATTALYSGQPAAE